MKTYAIIFPTKAEFANILWLLFGKPLCTGHKEDSLGIQRSVFFYKLVDPDIYYAISDYLASVTRKTKGHDKFMELHIFLNDQVEIKEDEDGQLMLTYGDYSVYASDRLKNYGVL